MKRSFQLVDVFNNGAFSGNPLAVVFDADDLPTSAMHAMTRWLNLSETAFLLRPSSSAADYRVRIFTGNYPSPGTRPSGVVMHG
jgi:PhzF family phenazine biosynthesis protein